MDLFENVKLFLMDMSNLGKDALHVYVGLGVMLLAAILLRRSLADWRPLTAVAFAAVAGELWDLVDTLREGGRHAVSLNAKDVWNTLFWPAILFLLARFTRVLKR